MLPKEVSELLRAAARRWAPSAQTEAIVRRIPRTRPGKKPARIAGTGNLEQFALARGFEVGVEDELGVVAGDEGGADGAAS